MNQTVEPQLAKWPSWNLPEGLNLFVIIGGFVAAIVLPFFPDVNQWPLVFRLGISLLCLMPLFIWLSIKIINTINIAWYRIRWYGKLYNIKGDLLLENTQLIEELRKEKGNVIIVRSTLALCFDLLQTFQVVDVVKRDGDTLCLVVEKTQLTRLQSGDLLLVVDSRDLEPLGQWKVEGIVDAGHYASTGYYASALQVRDQRWWDDMKQRADLHQHIDSTAMAILMHQ